MSSISYFTYVLNNDTLVIDETYGLKNLSMELISGGGSFIGETNAGGIASTSIPLYLNKPVTLTTNSVNTISGLTITTSGIVNIVAF
jgi:hypothetical protein